VLSTGDLGWLGHRSDPPCAQHPNLRGNAFRRMAGTPRAFFYSVAASRCAFGGWGELALKGVFSVGFPASLLGGFPCALGPKNGRKFTGDGPP
jgi:hypothetical protein